MIYLVSSRQGGKFLWDVGGSPFVCVCDFFRGSLYIHINSKVRECARACRDLLGNMSRMVGKMFFCFLFVWCPLVMCPLRLLSLGPVVMTVYGYCFFVVHTHARTLDLYCGGESTYVPILSALTDYGP